MLTSINPIWNELLETVASAIAECCVNVGSDEKEIYNNMEPFISKTLSDALKTTGKYAIDHYQAWLEGGQGSFSDSAQYDSFPQDYGITQDAFGVASGHAGGVPQGATMGYVVTTQLERIGILKSRDEVPAIDPSTIPYLLDIALKNNGFVISAPTGGPVPVANVKTQIIGTSNMYRFAAIVSEFLYRNISIFVCPEAPAKISYVFKAWDQVDTSNYGITKKLDPDDGYFDGLSDSEQRTKMLEYFGELLTGESFFVRDILYNTYKVNRSFQGNYV